MASRRSKLLAWVTRRTMKNRLGASGSVPKERENLEKMSRLMSRRAPGPEATINGVPGEWQLPQTGDGGRTILYLHGGGYVLGSPLSHRDLVGAIADAAHARAFIADYRLAPEHPFRRRSRMPWPPTRACWIPASIRPGSASPATRRAAV
jgi:acetyl esterase/lipase